MQYILVQDKETILLGPIFWKHRFIQSELVDLDIEFAVPPVEPNEYLKINDSIEIYPVIAMYAPAHNETYEQLTGPYWSFDNNGATGSFGAVPKQINSIKSDLKALAASERYKKEVAGIKMTIQDTEVYVATDRDSRNVYTQKMLSMTGDSVQWKFAETWLTLTKEELSTLLSTVDLHVQAQYDWESGIVSQIESVSSTEELKAIAIVEKTETLGAM